MKFFLSFVILFFTQYSFAQSDNAALNGWGTTWGAGTQSYTEDIYQFGGFTPYIFNWNDFTRARIALDYIARDMQGFADDKKFTSEIAISLQSENSLYKDVLSSYSKIGLGVLLMNSDIYDGSVLMLPVSFGFSALVGPQEKCSSSFFAEYRFNIALNYDRDKSLPGIANTVIDRDVFDSGSMLLGFRHAFN